MTVSKEKQDELIHRMELLEIKESDILEKFITGSGKGGQKINKTASCVYLKHLPTGLQVKCQNARSRELNRFLAKRLLCDLIEKKIYHKKTAKQETFDKIRKQKKRRHRRQKGEIISQTLAYAALKETAPLTPFTIERRTLRPHDVKIEILYCGVCHSDLHLARNEWKKSIYPIVPGHEIVGRVTHIGENVTLHKIGDTVAVGCLVDSCRTCTSCEEDLEQYCENEMTLTYNSRDKIDGSVTYGGYSSQIVVDEKFVLKVPKEFKEKDLAGVAPLLCAGITTYSPLKHWKIGKGSRVGVVGIGGLGHMAIKLSAAMGAHVVVFTTSPGKVEDAKRLGAHDVVISKNSNEMQKFTNSLDFIINTVCVSHNLDPFTALLKRDGTMCLVGAPSIPHPSPDITNLIFKRRKIGGSLIGGIKETQEMLDFCAKHHILSDIEVIPIQKINEAYERMIKSDVKYRFVIDLSSLKTKD